MPVVYRAKNYTDVYGDPVDLVHKIYPDGRIVTTYENDLHICEITRWKENNDLYEYLSYKSETESTYEHHKNGVLHRDDDEPAYSQYEDGYCTEILKWYVNGKLHRTRGPAIMKNYENEDVYTREYYIDGVKVSEGRG